jgi:galactoside O-acetyltransferase
MAFLSKEQLQALNFKSLGQNVKLSDKASIYGAEKIEIADNTRIDDFCILSAGEGGIKIGRYVHIACYTSLIGKGRIELKDFSNLSSRVAIYSSTDDFSGEWMTNPTVPSSLTNVTSGPVTLGQHVVVGTGSCILPNVEIGDGSAVAALSLVKNSFGKSLIIGGVPAKEIKRRKTRLFDLEKQSGI